MAVLPTSSLTTSSTATSGTLSTSSGLTLTYTGGTEILAHTIKAWFIKDISYYITNTGSDNIGVRIAFSVVDGGDDINLVRQTLEPGDSLSLTFTNPAFYIKVYVTPTSSSSAWKDEYIARWNL